MELEESTRGGQNEVMLECGLQRLPDSGRPGWAEAEWLPASSPQLCHVGARQALWERVSAALLAPAAAKLTRSQDSSVVLSLTRERLLLRKEVLLFCFPSLPLPCYCSAMGPFKVLSCQEQRGLQPRGTTGRSKAGSPSAHGVRRQHPYCSQAHDCLGAGWGKGAVARIVSYHLKKKSPQKKKKETVSSVIVG